MESTTIKTSVKKQHGLFTGYATVYSDGQRLWSQSARTLRTTRRDAEIDAAALAQEIGERNNTRLINAIHAAAALGTAAFNAGKQSIPRHDAQLMELIGQQGQQFGDSIALLDAWSQAWHAANVAAPVC
jgi:hypothetical protein